MRGHADRCKSSPDRAMTFAPMWRVNRVARMWGKSIGRDALFCLAQALACPPWRLSCPPDRARRLERPDPCCCLVGLGGACAMGAHTTGNVGPAPTTFNKWEAIEAPAASGASCGNGSPYRFFVNRTTNG